MPFDPQTAELTNRIRRGFGQRGAVSIHVDEVAVPVIPIYHLDKAPYRTSSQRFFESRDLAPAAGNVGRVELSPPAGGAAVVDQILIYNNTGAAQRFFIAVQAAAAVVGATECPELATGSTLGFAPVTLFASTPVAAGAFGQVLYQGGIGPTDFLLLPTEITINDGMELVIQTEVAAAAVRYSVNGRFYLPA